MNRKIKLMSILDDDGHRTVMEQYNEILDLFTICPDCGNEYNCPLCDRENELAGSEDERCDVCWVAGIECIHKNPIKNTAKDESRFKDVSDFENSGNNLQGTAENEQQRERMALHIVHDRLTLVTEWIEETLGYTNPTKVCPECGEEMAEGLYNQYECELCEYAEVRSNNG